MRTGALLKRMGSSARAKTTRTSLMVLRSSFVASSISPPTWAKRMRFAKVSSVLWRCNDRCGRLQLGQQQQQQQMIEVCRRLYCVAGISPV